jgi:hypothetical protein
MFNSNSTIKRVFELKFEKKLIHYYRNTKNKTIDYPSDFGFKDITKKKHHVEKDHLEI